jgi:DNA-binding transcriptional MerR regulator
VAEPCATRATRSASGHRLYAPADVRRLYALLAQRSLGLPLAEIDALLARDDGLAPAVRRHLARVEHDLAALDGLRARLSRLLAAAEGGSPPDPPLLDVLEAMSMIDKHYSAAQLEWLDRRREELGDDAIRAVERAWPELLAEVRALREAGTDPADPAARALADRADELSAQFHGGDPGVQASLERMYEQEGAAAASRGLVDPDDLAFLERVRKAR